MGIHSDENAVSGPGSNGGWSRRGFLRAGIAASAAAPLMLNGGMLSAAEPASEAIDSSCCFGAAKDRLEQGPFPITQDEGWLTLAVTTPSKERIRNFGTGLVGYTWEENGPALSVRSGKQKLADAIERMASLPFVDVLYIRCDWRDVQSRPGQLDLNPVWELTRDAARRHNLRFAFRIQLSNPEFEPEQIALPAFLRDQVPLVHIGNMERRGRKVEFVEPRYDHPAFQRAFRELNELLAAKFDGDPLLEWMDLMQYGFWGESHTSNLPNPFPGYYTAERTFLRMTELQLDTWKRTQLAVNTQPDISKVGNDEVRDLATRNGCWLRSDSIVMEEPIQIDQLANRPPWLATIMEDGAYRHHDLSHMPVDVAGVSERENAMLHVLDLGANYWALWTEAENLQAFNERYPEGFRALQQRMGYRVRPAWVWQRKRWGTNEIIVGVANDGVAGIPGVLRLTLESADGSVRQTGTVDPGQPYGGRIREASFMLPPGLGTAELKLTAQLETKAGVLRKLRWACRQPLDSDGAFPIKLKAPGDPEWRKGV